MVGYLEVIQKRRRVTYPGSRIKSVDHGLVAEAHWVCVRLVDIHPGLVAILGFFQ